MSESEQYWVYILQVENGSYYTGSTNNMVRRYRQHLKGTGSCKYTQSFRPVKIVGCWKVWEPRGTAMKIEHYIKTKKRSTKVKIIENPHLLKSLLLRDLELLVRIEPLKISSFSAVLLFC